jgi:hypothetical protein
MAIRITATAKKGAAPKALHHKLKDLVANLGPFDAQKMEVLGVCKDAANRLISRAPRGADISVQLLLEDDPYGGWSGSVMVDASPRVSAVRRLES